MAKRKRAKGGGRKPKGEFSGLARHFSIRMPDELHAQLVTAGKSSRMSIGQEILTRLENSFLAHTRSLAMQALCFLIARIGEEASCRPLEVQGDGLLDYDETGWRTDPYNFKVFQRAVAVLLAWLEPGGDLRPGERAPYDSPEDEGDSIAAKIWDELHHPPAIVRVPDKVFEDMLSHFPHLASEQRRNELRKYIEDRDYGMVKAKRHLLEAYATIVKEPGVEQAKPLAQPTSEPGQSDSAEPEPNRTGILGTLGEPFSSRATRKESNT
jgi:hypothetical protein